MGTLGRAPLQPPQGALQAPCHSEIVLGHARFPASCALNVSFGARLGARHANWFGTGELYRFYELRLGWEVTAIKQRPQPGKEG